jgi:hypothetical protein
VKLRVNGDIPVHTITEDKLMIFNESGLKRDYTNTFALVNTTSVLNTGIDNPLDTGCGVK